MEIFRNGSQPSRRGAKDQFTGSVRQNPLFQTPDSAHMTCALVTFEPGARTAWHTHPLGQTLIVVSGYGWVQHDGNPADLWRFELAGRHARQQKGLAVQERTRASSMSSGWN